MSNPRNPWRICLVLVLLCGLLPGCSVLFPDAGGPQPQPTPIPAPDIDPAGVRAGTATAAQSLPRNIQLLFYGTNAALADYLTTNRDAFADSRGVLSTLELTLKNQGYVAGQYPVWSAEVARATAATKVGSKDLTENMPMTECHAALTNYLRLVARGLQDALESGKHAP